MVEPPSRQVQPPPVVEELRSIDDFDDFYADHQPRLVRALALTLGDADLAAEAVDEAMARLVPKWTQVRQYDNPEGWAYRVALNWSTSVLRRRRRGRTLEPLYAAAEPTSVAAPADPDPRLTAAVAELPVRLRAVIVCRFYLDLDVDGTARSLGIKPGTVKSRQHRALAALESLLTEHAIEEPS